MGEYPEIDLQEALDEAEEKIDRFRIILFAVVAAGKCKTITQIPSGG